MRENGNKSCLLAGNQSGSATPAVLGILFFVLGALVMWGCKEYAAPRGGFPSLSQPPSRIQVVPAGQAPAAKPAAKITYNGSNGKCVFFEVSGAWSAKDIDMVEFSCNGFNRQVQVRKFRLEGNRLIVELYEAVPCGGRFVKMNYW